MLPMRDRQSFSDLLALMEILSPSAEAMRDALHGASVHEVIATYRKLVAQCDANRDGALDPDENRAVTEAMTRALVTANERAAIETLRQLARAQESIKESAAIDTDGDGEGEYAFFGELTGAVGVRGTHGAPELKLPRPALPSREFQVTASRVTRKGYVFQLYLPDAEGHPVEEANYGGAGAQPPGGKTAARAWCCYAWPLERGRTGARAFVISQAGIVLACERHQYSGEEAPGPAAALPADSPSMLEFDGSRSRAADGSVWSAVRE
jgi:hypothetical protein